MVVVNHDHEQISNPEYNPVNSLQVIPGWDKSQKNIILEKLVLLERKSPKR
jgi:hypothetical protein